MWDAVLAAFDPQSAVHRAAAAALHDRLVELDFGPDAARRHFGLPNFAAVRPARVDYYDARILPPSAAGMAARFFALHLPCADAALRGWLGSEHVRFLAEIGAIVPADPGWRAAVGATWFAGRLIFTDARAYNAVWPGEPAADYVMPPGADSFGLERVAPRTPRHNVLDLCCGAGAQTLAAAAYGERVTGVDVSARALRFARFNAAANRADNVTFVQGDGYAPLSDERYDAILANPPFVPWPADETALLFRGGGVRGEDVLAPILAGAVDRLIAPGSLALCADLANAPTLGERIIAWQGGARRTLILVQQHHELVDYAEMHAAHVDDGAQRRALALRLLRHYETNGIATLDFGYVLQDGEPGRALLVVAPAPLMPDVSADVAAWFAHQQRLAAGGYDDLPLEAAPGLGLLLSLARGADGTLSRSCYVVPGEGSLHPSGTVSAEAFALLERVASSEVRARDVASDPQTAPELARLLDLGLIRLRAPGL